MAAAAYTQDNRIAQLTTPLGKDVLLLSRFDAVEAVSEPFEFRVEALSTREALDFDPVRGQPCSVVFHTYEGRRRLFEGVLAETQWLGVRERLFVYRLVLRPSFWLLSFRRNLRIFHNKTVADILGEVLVAPVRPEFRLSGSFPKLEYCVQYRESDFSFASRLMEAHGISYSFSHTPGGHRMIVWNRISSLEEIEGSAREYSPTVEHHAHERERFYHWIPEGRMSSGRTVLRDYDFKKPSSSLEATNTGDGNAVSKQLEVYDYPGGYYERGDGDTYARARMESERAADRRFLAAGDSIGCMPGRRMQLEKHPVAAMNREYLVLRATHTFTAEDFDSSAGAPQHGDPYTGHYELFEADRPFAPPIVTEKPRVHGPQTAEVVGKGEIDVDEHGRIVVLFHWDRENANSCRVRVAQALSGREWGAVFIPRVGMEVIVDFLEGDPDRPIVIGAVYNGENKPPYPLPGEKNLSGLKSNSTEGGNGYNEFVFDDTKGDELVRLHAERDLESEIKNDERRKVGENRKTEIGKNETLNVGKVMKVDVGDEIEIVCGAASLVMKKDGTIEMKGMKVTVKAGAKLETNGMIADHTAGGVMTISGALVKIN